MLGATDYPILDFFWTMLIFFLWIVWIFILISVLIDIFRSHDLSGGMKALWLIFVIFLPLLGVLIYLIARGGKMHEHAAQAAAAQDAAMKQYIRDAVKDQTP